MNSRYCLFKTEKKRVVWEVTHKCNYSCLHCCSKSGNKEEFEMPYEKMIDVLNQLENIGVEEIYFSGGEPFTRTDMIGLLRETRERNILANVSTNGSFLTKEMTLKLREIDVNLIHISLDSHIESQFNKFRGGEYYKKTIEAIRNAKNAGLYVRVGAVIWKENVDELYEMILFLRELGVDEIVFNWLVKVGRLKDNNDKSISLDRFNETIERVNKYKEEFKDDIIVSMHRSQKYTDDGTVCQAGEQILFILPNGKISPCSWLAKLDESLITEKSLVNCRLNELLCDKEFKLWNEVQKKRRLSCKPGCPAICYERNGNYCSEDPLLK